MVEEINDSKLFNYDYFKSRFSSVFSILKCSYDTLRTAQAPRVVGVLCHKNVIKWKYFPRYWPFVLGIHRLPVNYPHKGQWRVALVFSLIYAWTSGWVIGTPVNWDAIALIMMHCNVLSRRVNWHCIDRPVMIDQVELRKIDCIRLPRR